MKTALILSLVILLSCVDKVPNTEVMQGKDNYKKVHSFINKDMSSDLYVKYINDSVFTHALIIDKNKGDTIYSIYESKFYNKAVVDFSVRSDLFFGYQIVNRTNEYFEIVLYSNEGTEVSDVFTIGRSSDGITFQVYKSP